MRTRTNKSESAPARSPNAERDARNRPGRESGAHFATPGTNTHQAQANGSQVVQNQRIAFNGWTVSLKSAGLAPDNISSPAQLRKIENEELTTISELWSWPKTKDAAWVMYMTSAELFDKHQDYDDEDLNKIYTLAIRKGYPSNNSLKNGFKTAALQRITERDAELPPPEETSDIKPAYDVKKGCALQALIGYGMTPFTKTTAKAVHDHIWATPALSRFRDYDVCWENLYRFLGLKKIANPAGRIDQITTLGKYLIETHGHMMAVSVTSRGTTLNQDPGNAIGKERDTVLKTYQ